MQPCLYIETATTSSLEGAATTVYAQGGRGNSRLIAWEGDRTMTLTIEDALMSTISFAMLSGAGVVEGSEENGKKVYMHTTYDVPVKKIGGDFYAVIDKDVRDRDTIFVSKEAPVYGVVLNSAGGVKCYLSAIKLDEISYGTEPGEKAAEVGAIEAAQTENVYFKLASDSNYEGENDKPMLEAGDIVRVDCYTVHSEGTTQINIDAENFAGYYYIEANTLFRDEETGKDFPAEFVIPRGKIQSNFTFSMASSGDPSTFTFTIDCLPAYTAFSKSKKVLVQLNVLDPEAEAHNYQNKDIHGHVNRDKDEDIKDYWGGSLFDEDEETTDEPGTDEPVVDDPTDEPEQPTTTALTADMFNIDADDALVAEALVEGTDYEVENITVDMLIQLGAVEAGATGTIVPPAYKVTGKGDYAGTLYATVNQVDGSVVIRGEEDIDDIKANCYAA